MFVVQLTETDCIRWSNAGVTDKFSGDGHAIMRTPNAVKLPCELVHVCVCLNDLLMNQLVSQETQSTVYECMNRGEKLVRV